MKNILITTALVLGFTAAPSFAAANEASQTPAATHKIVKTASNTHVMQPRRVLKTQPKRKIRRVVQNVEPLVVVDKNVLKSPCSGLATGTLSKSPDFSSNMPVISGPVTTAPMTTAKVRYLDVYKTCK